MTVDPDSDEWQLAGEVGVDSGSIALHDPCYWRTLEDTYLDDEHVGPAGIMGVVFESGNGDGSYPVEVRFGPSEFGDRRIAEVRIRLLNPDGSSPSDLQLNPFATTPEGEQIGRTSRYL